MNSEEAANRIAADAREGEELDRNIIEDPLKNMPGGKSTPPEVVKVDSTPAIYIDGKKLRNPAHKETWRQILGGRTGTVLPSAASPSSGGPLRPSTVPLQGVGPLRPPEPGAGR